MCVTRCVCHDVDFGTLIGISAGEGLSIEQIVERTGATTGCGTCEPYVRIALSTGRASLPPMSRTELDRALAACEARPDSHRLRVDPPADTIEA